jgi:16S rRNA (uracil1498-N3)-methyltransferase
MSAPIFYIAEPVTQPIVTLSEETSKHVVQVLRMKKGEEINLSDGNGTVSRTTIVDDHKKSCTVRVLNTRYEEPNTKRISIGISLLKNTSRFEWFLEKATEIGVTEIIPLLCDRTEKHQFKFERMNNILIAAMIQSQQSWLPKLHVPVAFHQAISSSPYGVKLIAHCEKEQKQDVKDYSNSSSAQILIGSEGDFSPEEIKAALQLNYLPVTLGQTRLRTETAGIVAAAILCG